MLLVETLARALLRQLINIASLGLTALLLLTSTSIAQQKTEESPGSSPTGFRPYEDSFVILNRMRNNGWAGIDETALRAHFSFKYSFCGPRLGRYGKEEQSANLEGSKAPFTLCPYWSLISAGELFVAYTGEFDFYWQTRDSGPVINRLSAPGIYVRRSLKGLPLLGNNWQDLDSLEVGLEHRSNGQVTDVTSDRGVETAQRAYSAGNRQYFDTVSRGGNYLTVALERRAPLEVEDLDIRVKFRFPLSPEESKITWGPFADSNRRLTSYDRIEIRASKKMGDRLRLDSQLRIGDKGLATASWTFGMLFNWGEVPLYLRYHRGPLNTLSNYTQRQDSIGMGLLLSRF